ncbi:beat protein [Holotrichia oblita]|uniref:Beat protein n=1 Tax=Holotrichia oblita TaxID=644536 RepID=A0ACB9SZX4_HOLOL|nr:beat protein [Holotrichia oblita]
MINKDKIQFKILLLISESASLKDVILNIEPQVVQRGGNSTLSCSYDLEDAQLYTVKWYRGNREFYRYTPSEHPSTKILPFKDNIPIYVDLHESNEHRVVLMNVEFHLSGNFSCEVTTEGPFLTIAANNHMIVVVKPESSPVLVTEQSFYDPGDILKANCSTAPSRPAATINFILNNVVVSAHCRNRMNK